MMVGTGRFEITEHACQRDDFRGMVANNCVSIGILLNSRDENRVSADVVLGPHFDFG
jgi:hypothetical protein